MKRMKLYHVNKFKSAMKELRVKIAQQQIASARAQKREGCYA